MSLGDNKEHDAKYTNVQNSNRSKNFLTMEFEICFIGLSLFVLT